VVCDGRSSVEEQVDRRIGVRHNCGHDDGAAAVSDPDALADIREADAAYARDDVLRGVDAVRRLRS
jgi:hypothetical protein